MTVQPQDIAVGKCYVTANDQVRRVLGLRGPDVVYQARSRTMASGNWGYKTTVSRANFAATVDREVPCDYDPDFGEDGVATAEIATDHPAEVATDYVAQAKEFLDRASAASSAQEKLAHLYKTAEILVQAIEEQERNSQTD